VLGRQWDKAVRYVAASDRQIGDDPTFDRRADAMAAHVRDVQPAPTRPPAAGPAEAALPIAASSTC
jgi:hypothetical protein